ncbi:hypothetical protein CIB95_00585 [Lottiidibacillus patelloidae]|uniref:Uncharacterized protein n=1 Tax=Lottiidibacillus patelloidae TaxID=2670334 RepID=A0A263BWJ7_9BACI|nr:hypothetical protein [Lottiidibacillus patelloidae]OZM58109.1 hypothetical protein CIB95_00585 [Lottiidibacillus patelloidae]
MKIVYDQSFNANEIFVILFIVLTFITIKILPKRFSKKETILFIIYGAFISTMFDNLIGIQVMNYYDINDSSEYSIYDALLYIGYGPVSYIFLYIYDRYSITGLNTVFYVTFWSLIAVVVELIAVKIGVFHYLNGYQTYFSFPIYLFVQCVAIMLFHLVKRIKANEKGDLFS